MHHRRPGGQSQFSALLDMGGVNGTKVNEATVTERELAPGDRITIGHTVLEFQRA